MVRRTTTIDVPGSKAGDAVRQYGSRLMRAILIVEETADSADAAAAAAPRDPHALEQLLAAMDADAVHAGGTVDDSRDALYTRLENE